MKAIYSFHWGFGRMGDVDGLFIADKDIMKKAIGKQVYFGEILGKHSEVYGTLDENDLEIKSEDQEFIKKFEEVLGKDFSQGYNPLDYIDDYCEDDTEEEE